MSPRKNNRHDPRQGRRSAGSQDSSDGFGSAGGFERREEDADGEWNVRMVSGANATKAYRCPGCDQLIPPGVPHVVAWPAAELGSADDRRHWHRPCWQARLRRSPRTQRSRNAPRY